MRNTVITLVLASIVGAGLLFVAVSNRTMGERRFVFDHEKGVYRGAVDPPLTPATIEALRARAAYQGVADSDGGLTNTVGRSGTGVRIGAGTAGG